MGDNKTKALHYFIREATVGELNYIIEDIGSILGNQDFMQEKEIVQALRGYYESHLTHHTLPGGQEVVVSETGRREEQKEGEGDEEHKETEFVYVDEARNIKFKLDVTNGVCKVIDDSHKNPDEAVQKFKETLVENLDNYIAEHYKTGTTIGTVAIEGEDQLKIHIDISCHNLNHKNFWGGEWLSRWTVTHSLNSSDYEFTGSIKISNHYFEQGNIQFKLDKSFESPISGAVKGGDTAQSIITHIQKLEEEYQNSLDAMYEDISENHMKSLRRKLPFTGKSFEWGVPKLV